MTTPDSRVRADDAQDGGHEAAARRTVEAVWRIESGRLIAGLARVTRDVGLAEEVAQDALVSALERWPVDGVPPNPAAWLTTTAKNRLIDRYRREAVLRRRTPLLERDAQRAQDDLAAALDAALDDPVGDDLLRLIFAACHPALPTEARVALTLRCLGGLTTEEIARAFLVPEATAAQRIVRAKRTLAKDPAALRLPDEGELPERLSSVLEVIYLIFNEAYAATAGAELLRRSLSDEAMRLGRILAALAPREAEVHGLLALMELQACRAAARTSATGETILLPDQDRRLWDRLLLRRGLDSLARACRTGGPLGVYTVQAAIAACHVRAVSAQETDWAAIVSLYDVLLHLWPSPVVRLNRAVAVSMSTGPQPALDLVDELVTAGGLAGYPHLASVRADLLARLGRTDEARAEFEHAASISTNERERATFREPAARLTRSASPPA